MDNQTIIFTDSHGNSMTEEQLVARAKPLAFGSAWVHVFAERGTVSDPYGVLSNEGIPKSHKSVTKASCDYLTTLLHNRLHELHSEKYRWEKMRTMPTQYENLIADCTREMVQIELALGELQ